MVSHAVALGRLLGHTTSCLVLFRLSWGALQSLKNSLNLDGCLRQEPFSFYQTTFASEGSGLSPSGMGWP